MDVKGVIERGRTHMGSHDPFRSDPDRDYRLDGMALRCGILRRSYRPVGMRSVRPNARLPLQLALAVVIPPLATVLAWGDIGRRRDLPAPLRGWWVVLCLIPVLGPLLYLGIGGGRLW